GYVSSPVWSDWVGVRLSGYGETQGGYMDDIRLKKDNANQTVRQGGRLTILAQPSVDWTFLLTGAIQHLASDDTQYTTPGLGMNRTNRILEPHSNDIVLGSAQLTHSWGWGELTSSTGVVHHAYASLYDATEQQNLFTRFAETSAYSERTSTNLLVEDLYLTSRGASRLQWLAGIYGSRTTEHSPAAFLAQHSFAPDVPVYSDDRRDQIDELAAYGELTYDVLPGWTVALGGRFFRIWTH